MHSRLLYVDFCDYLLTIRPDVTKRNPKKAAKLAPKKPFSKTCPQVASQVASQESSQVSKINENQDKSQVASQESFQVSEINDCFTECHNLRLAFHALSNTESPESRN